jgi:hypothetical protein
VTEVNISEAVIIRPGDTLLLRLSAESTRAPWDEAREDLRRLLPGVEVRAIIGVEQIAVYRPDPCACWDITGPGDPEPLARLNPACPQHGSAS